MSELSGYKLTTTWFEFCQSGKAITRPVHTALYVYCIHLCNKLKWREIFGLPTEDTMASLGISSYKTYISTLKDLVDFGFILWVEKSSNQFTSNKIALVKNAKASPKHIPKQVQSIVGIVKQLKQLKTVESVETLKTAVVEMFLKLRVDVPRVTLESEADTLFIKYPLTELPKDTNLVITWAKGIRYTKPVNQLDEFNKLAEQNRKKYGSA